MFSFKTQSTSIHNARLGQISTPHGIIETPNFIFCATKAAIKALSPSQMREAGTQIILSNTYHLMLQPGGDLVAKMGGLQKFTGWNGPMLTDSGGFQVFSLGHGSVASEIKGQRLNHRPKTVLKIYEQGVLFRSYWDGSLHLLSPEKSIRVQNQLGSDLIVVFDECTPYHVDKSYTQDSMRRSHRWALRSLQEFNRLEAEQKQRLYGIIQGGVYSDLRRESCDFVNSQPFFGHAIGGSLGSHKDQMDEVVGWCMQSLSKDRPVHLLGIGGIRDIWKGVEQGIDTFDCVHPTRLARHGGALVRPMHNPKPEKEHITLTNTLYQRDKTPIEPDCPCATCASFSKAYLHHLLKAKEILAHSLITQHNVSFMNRLMASIRQALQKGNWKEQKQKWVRD